MSTDILKQWFNEYLESGDGKGWRRDYESTFNKVQEIKQKLNNGYKLTAENDEVFLSELLKDDANGVASKGQILRIMYLNKLLRMRTFSIVWKN